MRRLAVTGRVSAAIAAVLLVTIGYARAINVNPTTAALSYLVVILFIATGWGIAEATAASLAAVLSLNFFFLPPVGTFTIADPQNWIALLAFLLTAIVTSQLSGRARQRHLEALARQRDLERLYALSRSLLLSQRSPSVGGAVAGAVAGAIARHVANAFELRAVGVYDQRADTVSWAGANDFPAIAAQLREAARTGASQHDASGLVITAIQLGGAPVGSLAITEPGLSDTVLQSIANLAAIGLERARAADATTRAEAARESSELRATILDALAHEFKTPLTSMKAASTELRASQSASPQDHELAAIIDEDVDRFQGLVTDAVQMLRIDAGDFAVHLGRYLLRPLVDAVVQKFGGRLEGHTVIARVPGTITVEVDRDLFDLALRQLVDNALKYSPPSSTIEIAAGGSTAVDVSVRNSDSFIPEGEQARLFERFYRGSGARRIPGTGMGLAIVQQIARAHGGGLSVASSPAGVTTFTLTLPGGTAT